MGLICNGYRNGHSPFRHRSGALVSIYSGGPALRNGYLPGRLHNWNVHTTRDVALPNGNLHPQSWMLPRTGGGMSMRVWGDGDLSADLIPTYPMTIDFTGAGDFAATAGLIVSMLCAMTGSGSMTATITGLLNASVDFTGDGDMAAAVHGIADMVVDMLGAGDLDATISAYGNMELDIVVTGTGLTTANVGQAVWSALAASNNDAGTMGEKLNDAGSASNPWTEVLESGMTAAEILRVILSGVAGDCEVTDNGNGTYTIAFKSVDGTITRITGLANAAGERSGTTLDGS